MFIGNFCNTFIRIQYYLHKGHTTFDTGLKLELLQEYCVPALDVFREKPYPKDGCEQTLRGICLFEE